MKGVIWVKMFKLKYQKKHILLRLTRACDKHKRQNNSLIKKKRIIHFHTLVYKITPQFGQCVY